MFSVINLFRFKKRLNRIECSQLFLSLGLHFLLINQIAWLLSFIRLIRSELFRVLYCHSYLSLLFFYTVTLLLLLLFLLFSILFSPLSDLMNEDVCECTLTGFLESCSMKCYKKQILFLHIPTLGERWNCPIANFDQNYLIRFCDLRRNNSVFFCVFCKNFL